jgi:hypothetical protein
MSAILNYDHAMITTDVVSWDQLPRQLSWKEKIAYLGVQFKRLPQQSECPVEHIFGHGKYIRHITIPARTLFLGRGHIHGHECTLLSGSVILITPTEKQVKHAVTTVHTTPGYHMVVYALTDVEAQTVHPNPTNSTNAETLEADIFESVDALYQLGIKVEQNLRLT